MKDVLVEISITLEARLAVLGVPATAIDKSKWEEIEREIKLEIPKWLKTLLGERALCGGVLEYRDGREPTSRLFRFFDDRDFIINLGGDSVYRTIIQYGYFPFAYESDGSVWLVAGGRSGGEIFLLDQSGWNGERPSLQNGLRFAASRLEFLLASMAISDLSYPDDRPHSVIWYPAKYPRAIRAGAGE